MTLGSAGLTARATALGRRRHRPVENHAGREGRKAEMTLGSAGLTARATALGRRRPLPHGRGSEGSKRPGAEGDQ
jgi:hypothetical protein